MVLIVIAGVTLGAGAVAAYVLLGDARPAESQPAADAPSGLVPLETFLVNIAGNEGRAYLRVTLKVLVADKHQAEQILENEVTLSLMRNAILETLAIQSADELARAEGKTALKQALITKLSELLKPNDVRDVLYSDFVIQF